MKAFLATTIIVAGALLAGGCATKKYVRNTTAPIQAKVDQVGEQTTQNGQQIQSTRNDLKALDDKTAAGINAAKESASAADAHAGEADRHATDAMNKATQADQKADSNAQAVNGLRGTLANAVANIDDYKLQTNATVPFQFDRATLSDSAREDLDKLAQSAQTCKRYFIAVSGFTDKTGSKEYNEALSRRRAEAVVQYLVAKDNVPFYKIHMIGLGEDKPADDTNTREARAKNRRVEVEVYSADGVAAGLSSDAANAANRVGQ
ncbi:MAG TPA: OmpA family protein [Verrucomicrobiae bacterium]|nr:OmpA family protein [Verrucomicrobiae bacterium]